MNNDFSTFLKLINLKKKKDIKNLEWLTYYLPIASSVDSRYEIVNG